MTDLFPNLVSIGGIALCGLALLQLAFWSVQSLGLIGANRKQYELSRELLRNQIEQTVAGQARPATQDCQRWNGYRTFRVTKLERETPTSVSVYLQPVDRKPFASFRPGQHLTIRLNMPDRKPAIRCYSLSDRPGLEHYRITVKSVAAPADQSSINPGMVSSFINEQLKVDDEVDIKSPAGNFVLDESVDMPLVLLAGGIGVTPLTSMVNHLIATESQRKILLVYGVRNSAEHTFKKHFEHLSRCHNNFCLVNCYSNPGEQDLDGVDYHIRGHVSAELVRQIVPDRQCQFMLCGPPGFMASIYHGLISAGIEESSISYESFGPASIPSSTPSTSRETPADPAANVVFAQSQVTAQWSPGVESILELAESSGVSIDSGCRAGNCGTCETGLVRGTVTYPENLSVECSPGTCLVCVARPDGAIELDA